VWKFSEISLLLHQHYDILAELTFEKYYQLHTTDSLATAQRECEQREMLSHERAAWRKQVV